MALADKFIIVENGNEKLKLFAEDGECLSTTPLTHETHGITEIDCDRFATCGVGNQVFFWKIKGDTIIQEDISYEVEHVAHGIHYDGTYYCVLHPGQNAVTIFDNGGYVRMFVILEAFGREMKFSWGWDIHIDRGTHNVYIPCWGDNKGILCVSVEGEVLRFDAFDGNVSFITEVYGLLCIADCKNNRVNLISKDWISQSQVLDIKPRQPHCVAINKSNRILIISYKYTDVIGVFSLK